MLEQKPDLNINCSGDSVFMKAFEYCKDKDVLLKLLEQKPDLNLRHNFGDTIAIELFYNCKHNDVLLEVLKQKPNLDIQDSFYKKTIGMIVFQLCDNKDVLLEVVNQLQDFNLKDYKGNTVFDYAMKYYIKSENVDYDIFKKLYYKCYEQNKNLQCLEYYLLI
jgi:ankyrin repeat protein